MYLGSEEIARIILQKPTGIYVRRIWFLYEWLTDKTLDIPDLRIGGYTPVVDPAQQYAVEGARIARHRVVDNLPGTRAFCPLVRRTPLLESYIGMNLSSRARDVIAKIPMDVMNRTAAFLLLKDSRASYAIEGETPTHTRLERWRRAIAEAGTVSLTKEELLRLQRIIIGNTRFIRCGLRTEGGFVGEHDRETGMPMPEHISARADDLDSLIDGVISYGRIAKGQLDPVVSAAALAFGFVYIHPFADGNGRLHRYLIHQVLCENDYNPQRIIFPVSAAMLENIDGYRDALRSYSKKILPLVEWEPTDDNNVRVINKTDDYYRYFDATGHAEYLFSCVLKTIAEYLPDESRFLQQYDAFRAKVEDLVEMPSRTLHLLFRFLVQNNGRLSARAREKEFSGLTDSEAEQIETIYRDRFMQC
jgi:hypothetical protein